MPRIPIAIAIAWCTLIAPAVSAAEPEPPLAAVLPCEAGQLELVDLAKALPELIGSLMSEDERVEMVERTQLKRILEEQALGATGILDPDQVARVGQLLGADLLVTPRVYKAGGKVFATVKVINVETGRVRSATTSVSGLPRDPTFLAKQVADAIGDMVDDGIAAKGADEDAELDALIEQLKAAVTGKPKPVVTVVVPEEHIRREVPDPAVKTELSYLLRRLRFKVVENDSPLLDQWVKDQFAGRTSNFPPEVGNVDVVIHGGAFAETVGNVGNLVSARARVELSAIEVGTGLVLTVAAKSASAADLSENVAGKSALEKGARACAERFVPELVEAWADALAEREP